MQMLKKALVPGACGFIGLILGLLMAPNPSLEGHKAVCGAENVPVTIRAYGKDVWLVELDDMPGIVALGGPGVCKLAK